MQPRIISDVPENQRYNRYVTSDSLNAGNAAGRREPEYQPPFGSPTQPHAGLGPLYLSSLQGGPVDLLRPGERERVNENAEPSK